MEEKKKVIPWHKIAAASFLLLAAYLGLNAIRNISNGQTTWMSLIYPAACAIVAVGIFLGKRLPIAIGFAVMALLYLRTFIIDVPVIMGMPTLWAYLVCDMLKVAAAVLLILVALVDKFPQCRQKLTKYWYVPVVLYALGSSTGFSMSFFLLYWKETALFSIGALLMTRWLLDMDREEETAEPTEITEE